MRLWKRDSSAKWTGGRRPRKSAGVIIALGLFALLAPEPASAQYFEPGPGPGLPPFAVRRMMNERGFRVLAPPFRRGDVYVVDAIDRDGRQIRAIVDAYEGRIVRTFVVWGRMAPPNRPVIADERMPFPDEDRGGRYPRARDTDGGGGGGLFGFFARPSTPPPVPPATVPGGRYGEPRVVPGIGPDTPRPHRVAKPKPAAPRAVVRATPAPLPGPQTIPAAVNSKATNDKPAPKVVPPPPPPSPAPAPVAKRESSPPPATPTPSGARVPTTPKSEAQLPSSPKPRDAQGGTTPKPSADKPVAEKQAPPKVSAAKKKSGPLNDIPPAPLE